LIESAHGARFLLRSLFSQ